MSELVLSECWWMKSMCFLVWLKVCVCLMHAPRIFSSNWTQVYSKRERKSLWFAVWSQEGATYRCHRQKWQKSSHTSRALVLLFTIVWLNERSTAYLEIGFYSLDGENDWHNSIQWVDHILQSWPEYVHRRLVFLENASRTWMMLIILIRTYVNLHQIR